jgi:ATP-dependent 26S proteasome regulatory subunit
MDVVVHFVPPSLQERWAIWQLHLPLDHAVDSLYLEQIATRCAMTGGQIRNAALHATLLAVHDGSRAVTHCHVEQAIQSEYCKSGALCPLRDSMHEPPSHNEVHGGVEAFVQALSFGHP